MGKAGMMVSASRRLCFVANGLLGEFPSDRPAARDRFQGAETKGRLSGS